MASMSVDKIDPAVFLGTLASKIPSDSTLTPLVEKFRIQYDRRLWHQLTITLEKFFDDDLSAPYQEEVFSNFVRDFESKLNPLRLVELGVRASKQINDPSKVLEFLTSLLSRISKETTPEAYVLLLSSISHAKLLYGDMEGTRTDVEEAGKVIDTLDGIEPSVHAAYYAVSADYYKARADYVPYYKNSLLYLACVDPDKDLDQEERTVRAHDLGLSALLGETIYNFGELLIHPLLNSLDGTEHAWLKDLLFTFNEGKIEKFESISTQLGKEPLLQNSYAFLRQKICLMALIEAVFKRSANNRSMTFEIIAKETRLPTDEVEHLVMKALSLKLIRGRIDQVDEKVHIDWVQPRVLSKSQIGALSDRLTTWIERLNTVDAFVQSNTKLLAV